MAHHATGVKRRKPRFRYIGEVISELKKVVWLTRREIVYLTIVVLIVSVAFGIFLGALDYGFTNFIDKVFLGR